jgi:hypothetical protein
MRLLVDVPTGNSKFLSAYGCIAENVIARLPHCIDISILPLSSEGYIRMCLWFVWSMCQISDLNQHKIESFVCCVLRLILGFESLMEKSIDCFADIAPGREN